MNQSEEITAKRFEGDGINELIDFYILLWKKSKELKSCDIKIPMTVIYKRDFPVDCFFYDKKNKDILRRTSTDIDSHKILHEMKEKTSPDCEISCFYMSTHKKSTTIEYFTIDELEKFLFKRSSKRDGILQHFIRPKKAVNDLIRIIWTPTFVKVDRRENINRMDNISMTLSERAATFAGNPVHSKEVLVTQLIKKQLKNFCVNIVKHFREVAKLEIVRQVLFFKVDQNLDLWLLWPSSIRNAIEQPTSKNNKRNRSTCKLPPLNLQMQYETVNKPNFHRVGEEGALYCKCCGKMTKERLVFPSSYALAMIKNQEKLKRVKKKFFRNRRKKKKKKEKKNRCEEEEEEEEAEIPEYETDIFPPTPTEVTCCPDVFDKKKKVEKPMTPPNNATLACAHRKLLFSPSTRKFITNFRSCPSKLNRMKLMIHMMYDVLNDVTYFMEDHFLNQRLKVPFVFEAPSFSDISCLSGEIEERIQSRIMVQMEIMGVRFDEQTNSFVVKDLLTSRNVKIRFNELKDMISKNYGVKDRAWKRTTSTSIQDGGLDEEEFSTHLKKYDDLCLANEECGEEGCDVDGFGDSRMKGRCCGGGRMGRVARKRFKFRLGLREDCTVRSVEQGSIGRTVNLCFDCSLYLVTVKDHVKEQNRRRYSVVGSRIMDEMERMKTEGSRKRRSIADLRKESMMMIQRTRHPKTKKNHKYRSRVMNLEPVKKVRFKSITKGRKKKKAIRRKKLKKIVLQKEKLRRIRKRKKNSIFKDFNEIIPNFTVVQNYPTGQD